MRIFRYFILVLTHRKQAVLEVEAKVFFHINTQSRGIPLHTVRLMVEKFVSKYCKPVELLLTLNVNTAGLI